MAGHIREDSLGPCMATFFLEKKHVVENPGMAQKKKSGQGTHGPGSLGKCTYGHPDS